MDNRKGIWREKYEKSGGNYEIGATEKHPWEKTTGIQKVEPYPELCVLSG